MSRLQVSKVILALIILIRIQTYNAKRKDVSTKENTQSLSGKELSNGLLMGHNSNPKSRQLKKKLRAKQGKQKLPTKSNEKTIFKRKGKDKRKGKGKNKRKGKGKGKQKGQGKDKRKRKSSNELGKIKKIKKMRKQMLSKKAEARSSRSAPIVGDICQFVDFFGARRMGTGCEDGSKVVITQRSGVRKQFLIAGGRTIFGFVDKQGGKFRNCTCATEKTSSAQCKVTQA